MTTSPPPSLPPDRAVTSDGVRAATGARRIGWVRLGKQLAHEMGNDHVMAFAGNMAFRMFLALFPTFVFLLSLLGAFGATGLVRAGLDSFEDVLPAEAVTLIRDQLVGISQSQASEAFTIGAIVSAGVALWGLSGMMRTAMESLNVMYNVEEDRSFVRRYLISFGLALAEAVLFIAALVLIVVGASFADAIGNLIGLGDTAVLVWSIVRWPALFVVLLVALGLLYWVAPNVSNRFRVVSPGALVAVVLWLIFSAAFSIYVNQFGSYNATYGAFAGIVVLLLYALYASAIILMGAELNQILERNAGASPATPDAPSNKGSEGGDDHPDDDDDDASDRRPPGPVDRFRTAYREASSSGRDG